ncbi:unnamed protein product [Sordaria macrospora k-hell]|uniref:WGS project CABT00000000 data, contig 2.27 n=1 Tax=Sordaria macrospora (strain ATCC MYA-333 / DSM 997 / K(L3346) / K-hell) TaxID=771870 RepID=F7W4E2_SORMK|nr:uncharacterized protein SMAC_12750 [Sordaria macrospora k-hell]CCC14895.1 unnamed protein product [Sordaria macrospora k-hell]
MFPILLLPSRRRCSDSDSDNKASHSRPPIRLRCRRKELLKSEPEWGAIRLFKLLLGAELVGVAALALAAVGGTRRETSVALAANHLVAVELRRQRLEGWFNHLDGSRMGSS